MKSLLNVANPPKMIIVNGVPETNIWNKHLLKPFIKGEIVKVHPVQEHKRFIRVIRKNADGVWNLEYVESCESFDLLKSK